jgi:hypothetical protein
VLVKGFTIAEMGREYHLLLKVDFSMLLATVSVQNSGMNKNVVVILDHPIDSPLCVLNMSATNLLFTHGNIPPHPCCGGSKTLASKKKSIE